MSETPGDPVRKRSTAARIGVTALNILQPGLGSLRLGRWRSALAWCALYQLPVVALLVLMRAPVPGFAIVVGTLLSALFAGIAALVGSIVATWRHSARIRHLEWWSRWYVIAALMALVFAENAAFPSILTVYRTFYIPSVSMMPTFAKNDRLIADMRWRTPQVGNIILVHAPSGENRIYRVAAIGGQTFAMKDGVPIIDGQAATQSPAGQMTMEERLLGKISARLFREHLPGEQGSHSILKVRPSPQDEMATVRIPAGSVFLLGDDRDMSADSRIPLDMMGIGTLPVSAIMGRPLYFLWSGDHRKIGQRADH